ncbi:MAG: hypothetical protein JCHSAcid_01470 [uncultured Acidilobus sp. JCHS]|nr:MAG: hypothetical protein JCHSAcid_01470 [uncultured Acidilobus sp. JCHS]
MSEGWRAEASRLLELARGLKGEARDAFLYFLDNVSVGDLRAIRDLSKKGIRDPAGVIEELIEVGLLERGRDCFNVPEPLRRLIAERGVEAVLRTLGTG